MFFQLNNFDVLIIFFFGVYVLLFFQLCELFIVFVLFVFEKVLNELVFSELFVDLFILGFSILYLFQFFEVFLVFLDKQENVNYIFLCFVDL